MTDLPGSTGTKLELLGTRRLAVAVDDFKNAIGGDVIISGLNRPGGASLPDILASRSWFDRHVRSVSGNPEEATLSDSGT